MPVESLQLNATREQAQALRALSFATRVPMSELLRQAIDMLLASKAEDMIDFYFPDGVPAGFM